MREHEWMIGRRHHVVTDCPNPAALAAFYSELIRLPVTYWSDDWVVIAENETMSGFAFQLAPDRRPPQCPIRDVRSSSTSTLWSTTSAPPDPGAGARRTRRALGLDEAATLANAEPVIGRTLPRAPRPPPLLTSGRRALLRPPTALRSYNPGPGPESASTGSCGSRSAGCVEVAGVGHSRDIRNSGRPTTS